MAAVSAMNSATGMAGNRQHWDYAVPIGSENNTSNSRSSASDHSYSTSAPRQPLSTQTNGTSLSSLPQTDVGADSTFARQNQSSEYVASTRTQPLSRKASDLASRRESENQSASHKARNRSQLSGSEHGGKRKNASGSANGFTGQRDEYWIHRDKLAQIESRELEEAGFRVPGYSRATSRAANGSVDFRDDGYPTPGMSESDSFEFPIGKRQRALTNASTDSGDGLQDWELRMPEEVAEEQQQHEVYLPYTRPPPRQNGSRIPIKKSGTFSITSQGAERESTHARSRNPSGNYTAIPEPRHRSQSVESHTRSPGEHHGLDRPRTPTQISNGTGSSDKENSPIPISVNKTASRSGNSTSTATTPRKPTNPRTNPSATRGRVPSKSDSPPKRPGTSSGLARPSTSQQRQMEGEAPWIASMYKPDPRLPPDQQMLPTHAKRMAQEQWEKEGKVGTVYDRDFRPLNVQGFPEQPPHPSPAKDMPPTPGSTGFMSGAQSDFFGREISQLTIGGDIQTTTLAGPRSPLDQPLGSPRSFTSQGRPGTSGSYKLMPSTSNAAGPGPGPAPASVSKPTQPVRVPEQPQEDEKEEGKKKKKESGCGCVVM